MSRFYRFSDLLFFSLFYSELSVLSFRGVNFHPNDMTLWPIYQLLAYILVHGMNKRPKLHQYLLSLATISMHFTVIWFGRLCSKVWKAVSCQKWFWKTRIWNNLLEIYQATFYFARHAISLCREVTIQSDVIRSLFSTMPIFKIALIFSQY